MKIKSKLLVAHLFSLFSLSAAATSLSESYVKALEYSAEVAEKIALEEVGSAMVLQTESLLGPSVIGSYDYGHEDQQTSLQKDGNNDWIESFSLMVQMPIYDSTIQPKIKKRILERNKYLLDTKKVKQALALDVSKSYFEVLSALQKREMLDSSVALYTKKLDQAVSFLKRGLSSQVDVLRAQAEYDEILSQMSLVESDIKLAKANFESLVGEPWNDLYVPPEITINSKLPGREKEQVDWLSLASGNIDLKIAQLEVNIAKTMRKQAEAERLPVVSFEAGYEESDQISSYNRIKDQYGRVTVEFDFYRGNYFSARSGETRWNLLATEKRMSAVTQKTDQQIRQSWSYWLTVYEQFSVESSRVESAQKYLEYMLLSEARGLEDLVELYDAQENLTKAKFSLIDAYYNSLYAYLELQAQVGKLDDGSLARVPF